MLGEDQEVLKIEYLFKFSDVVKKDSPTVCNISLRLHVNVTDGPRTVSTGTYKICTPSNGTFHLNCFDAVLGDDI